MIIHCSYCNSDAVMPKSGLCLTCGNVTKFDNQNSVQTSKQLSEKDNESVSGQTTIKEPQEITIVETPVNESVAVVDHSQTEASLLEKPANTSIPIEEEETSVVETPVNESVAIVDDSQSEASLLEKSANTSDSIEEQQTLDIETPVHEVSSNTTNFKTIEATDKCVADTDSGLIGLGTSENDLLHKGKINYPLPKGNSAKLDINQKKIITSCEGVYEQLKGKLGAKSNHYKSLMITSANSQDGVTVSSIAIAVALARYGHSNVLLIDANSGNQGISKSFSLTETAGFFEYMSGKEVIKRADAYETIADAFSATTESTGEKLQHLSWTQSVFYTEYKNLFVMPFAKEKNGSLWDLIDNAGVDLRLSDLSQCFDFVIIDSPAVMKSSEAQILSGYLDGVIFVIKAEKTKWEVAKIALNNIENSGGKVIGSILNRRKFYIPNFLYRWM